MQKGSAATNPRLPQSPFLKSMNPLANKRFSKKKPDSASILTVSKPVSGHGASEGTRTPMHKAQDPKSCASANSATLA